MTAEKDAERVAVDFHCVRCGYNLRSLALEGICPECATKVRVSVRQRVTSLSAADLDGWEKRNTRLMGCMAAALALLLGGALLFELSMYPRIVHYYVTLITLVALIATWMGWAAPEARLALLALTGLLAARTVVVWMDCRQYDQHGAVGVSVLLSLAMLLYSVDLRRVLPFKTVGLPTRAAVKLVVLAALGAIMTLLDFPTEHAAPGLTVFVNLILFIAAFAGLARTNAALRRLVPAATLTADHPL